MTREMRCWVIALVIAAICLGSAAASDDHAAAAAAAVPRASFWETAKRYVLLAAGYPVSNDQAADDAAAGITRLTRGNIGLLNQGEWVVLVHGTDPLSPSYLRAHTHASLASAQRGDVSRWGRVEYGAEGEVCTRWMIFRPPYLVFVSDRGQSTRFLSSKQAKSDGQLLDEFVATRQWVELPIWNSPWSPGGRWSGLVEGYIFLSGLASDKLGSVPPFVWMLLSGAAAQALLRWMHSGSRSPSPGPGPATGSGAGAGAVPRAATGRSDQQAGRARPPAQRARATAPPKTD